MSETSTHPEITQAVVVGAGTMGHGIAHVLALAGITTSLLDVSQAAADTGLQKIHANLDGSVKKGKLSTEDATTTKGRLTATEDWSVLATADLFVEAVPEKMELKKQIFAKASQLLPAHALLGSNTSSLSITEIASAAKDPSRVIGMHFFNPVHIMKLLEIVRGTATSEETVTQTLHLAERIKKTTIVVRDFPGFATSRLGICLGNEAMRMFEQGVATAKDIDDAMQLGYGHPMGPLALTDLVGLDVRLAISEALYSELGTDGFRPPLILRRLVRAGALGKKAGRGFYIWKDGAIVGPNPEAK